MSKLNIVLDASMLDMFSLCEERFRLRYREHKILPTKAKPLDRGSLVHTGLEHYYRAIQDGYGFGPCQEAMTEAVMKSATTEDSDLDMDEVDKIIRVLREHTTFWQATDARYEILAVEQPFTYLLHEDEEMRIIMAGKIDLIVNDLPNYHNLVIDHKSYEREYPVRKLNHQFSNYCVAADSHFLIVDKVGFQKSLTPVQKFKRVPVSYDELFLEQWKKDVVKIVNRYITCIATDEWMRNHTSCDKFFRSCEYLEVCEASGTEAKVYKLKVNFKTGEPWDPTKVLQNRDE